MDIETRKESKNMAYTCKAGESQVVIQCDVMTDNNIKEVLSATGSVVPIKVDVFDGEAKVQGKVCYSVIYVDDSDTLGCREYCSDFVETVSNGGIKTNSVVTPELTLVDIDSMAKGSSVRVQAVVDIELYMVACNKYELVTDVSNTLTRMQNIKTSTHICHIDSIDDVMDEYSTGCNIDDILYYATGVTCNNITINNDKVTVTGEATACIIYTSEGKSATKNVTIPYNTEVRALGADSSSGALMSAYVKDSKIVLGGVEDDNTIKVEMTIALVGDVYAYDMASVVQDAYSTQAELDVERESVGLDVIEAHREVDERVSAETSIGDDGAIGHIVGVTHMPCSMVNVKVEDGNVTAESVVTVCVMYADQDGQYHSIALDIPSSIAVPCEDVMTGDDVHCNVVVKSATCRVKRERDIEVLLELSIECMAVHHMSYNVVSAVTCKGERHDTHKGMSVYFASAGDTMWDVVKSLGASEEIIRACNSDIDLDNIVGGEHIMVIRDTNV